MKPSCPPDPPDPSGLSQAPPAPRWLDTGCRPPQRLPDSVEAAIEYVAQALGHPVYIRWTLAILKRGCPSLADAKHEHPSVFALLLDHDAAVEYWERGRLRAQPETVAPSAAMVLERVLRQHRRRFRLAPDDEVPDTSLAMRHEVAEDAALKAAGVEPAWLARAGRFASAVALTNTLGVADDAQAVRLFLRERASHSPHTLRAYVTELRRLAAWCTREHLGPFSDLTRQDLMAYRDVLQAARAGASGTVRRAAPASVSRALAVVSSLYAWWHRTGYLSVNPAEGLAAGRRARMTWTPVRFLSTAALAHCDAVAAGDAPEDVPSVIWARRRAIWALYRFAGIRLAELVWNEALALPRIEVDAARQWTLHVNGKGNKVRAVPLPSTCLPALRAYRRVRGLPDDPPPGEQLPLIHSERGRALGGSGLYDEVRAVFALAATRLPPEESAMRAALEGASTHWLRHGYARTLVVDHRVPLPVAQALLGHASVQTTAAYARTDGTQLRDFVEGSFPVNPR
ncbi:site-specific recombinase XerD [Paraburkholderia bannensis]|uniref:Site-specific recombinase XerD n=1 Tax=Paraburkholderia bannensis TaxID=765414 RepID=A0A7W9WX57_9BURK|nr:MULTISPECIES: tyrosine-type recombinase/integrase [Paraburkholderia]MBB3261878.1 site-specific recombinase XerD [Paraburkholderia sp. WP4_3_2]MBB6106873.1 site-specific recombinase XerD [Paraburkholderia bannensis]